MLKKILLIVVVMCLCMSGFAAEDIDAKVKKFVSEQVGKAPKIDAPTLKSWIEAKKSFLLLDVREPDEVTAGKIYADNVAYFPRGVIEFYFVKKYKDADQSIVVVCKSGARGAIVTNRLLELGYKNVVNLDKGVLAWLDAGCELENSLGYYKKFEFK